MKSRSKYQTIPRGRGITNGIVTNSFNHIIRIAINVVSNSASRNNCVLFVEENGMIGFGPTNTQIGDVVCGFEDSGVIAIVRRVGQGHTLVGRATNFLTSCSAPLGHLGEQIGPNIVLVAFSISAPGLQILMRLSAYDPEASNIEIVN